MGRLQTWSRQIYGQFHDPGSFMPLLLLMCPVGGGGYTVYGGKKTTLVKKKKTSLVVVFMGAFNIQIILGFQIIYTTDLNVCKYSLLVYIAYRRQLN